MKRLFIALAAVGLSASAFAALPAATDPTLVSVPQLPGGFYVGATAFYLESSTTSSDLDYASIVFPATTGFYSKVKSVEPGFDWGWGVNAGYIFPQTGNDVDLSYFQISTDDKNSILAPGLPTGAPTNIETLVNLGGGNLHNYFPLSAAEAKAQYDVDQVDLVFGQFINVGCRLILHPNVGLRYASVDRQLDSYYLGVPVSTTTVGFTTYADSYAHVRETSDYSGIGPLAGIDASYYVANGFGFVAHAKAGLLVGSVDSKTQEWVQTGGNTSPQATSGIAQTYYAEGKSDSVNRVVPVTDLKLGADYTYVFNNTESSDLTLEAGWQVTNYFNAVDRLQFTGHEGTTGSVGTNYYHGHAYGRETSDVGFQGPYVSLTFHA